MFKFARSQRNYKLTNGAIKRNEVELFVVRWMDLESVIQSEVREKQIQYANTYIWNLKKKWL